MWQLKLLLSREFTEEQSRQREKWFGGKRWHHSDVGIGGGVEVIDAVFEFHGLKRLILITALQGSREYQC